MCWTLARICWGILQVVLFTILFFKRSVKEYLLFERHFNMNMISEWHKSAKRLPCSSDFMNKIEERSNTILFQPNRLYDWSPCNFFFKHGSLHSKNIYHLCNNLKIWKQVVVCTKSNVIFDILTPSIHHMF